MFSDVSFGMSLPSGINLSIVMIAFVTLAAGIMMFLAAKKKRNEDALMYLIDAAKEENKPIIVPIDLAGHGQAYLGTFDDPKDIKFKDIPFGLQVRPSLLEKAYPIYMYGVRWYFYFGNMYFPTNLRDAFALSSLIERFRKEYPRASFVNDDVEIIHMLCIDTADDLKYNCRLAVETFEQAKYLTDENGEYIQETEENETLLYNADGNELLDEDGNPEYEYKSVPLFDEDENPVYVENTHYVSDKELYSIIKSAKEKLFNQKIRTGYMHIKEAVALMPFSLDGLVMDRIIKITEQKVEARIDNSGMPWWAMMVIAIFGILGGVMFLAFLAKTLLPMAT